MSPPHINIFVSFSLYAVVLILFDPNRSHHHYHQQQHHHHLIIDDFYRLYFVFVEFKQKTN